MEFRAHTTATLILAILPFALPAFAANTASFGGIVVADTGEPVSGVQIQYQGSLLCNTYYGVPCINGTTTSDSIGHFAVTALPADRYYLCAFPPAGNLIATCQWPEYGGESPFVTLLEGQQLTDLRPVLRHGTIEVFKVRDDDNLLSSFHFSLAVWADGGDYAIASFDDSRQAYTVLVPTGITVRLFPDTPLIVYNEAGNSIPIRTPGMPITTTGTEMLVPLTVKASLVNAASFWPGAGPGIIASLFGSALTNVQGIQAADMLPLPTQIAGTSITVNGTLAPLFAVANQNGQEQINFLFPFVSPDPSASPYTLVVNNNGKMQTFYAGSDAGSLPGSGPGIFTTAGQPAITHAANGQLVSPSNPVISGEAIAVYWTASYAFSPRIPDGYPAPSSPLVQCFASGPNFIPPPQAHFGDVIVQASFCGAAPGFVGLGQMNVVVPTLQPGTYGFSISVGGPASNQVQMWVQ
jgi:uncharacterized protein (TIGR03437 family)